MEMSRAYRTLLRIYPADYRARFTTEMIRAFEQASNEHRGRTRFVVAECTGLFVGALAEWIAKWTTDPSIRGRSLPDIRMMRPPDIPREVWFAGLRRDNGCS